MLSVTQRIRTISQPRGGYLPVKTLEKRYYRDGNTIDTTSTSYQAYSSIQGMAVDYLTRFMCGFPAEKVFLTSLAGANKVNEIDKARELITRIKGIDIDSIVAACKLSGYDVAFRRGKEFYTSIDNISPDQTIVNNIGIMVRRGIRFLKKHGKVLDVGFTFEGGYTKLVSSGDGDYLTSDGIWDFKTSLHDPNSAETLQVLMYYALAVHSEDNKYNGIKTLGLFNPLKNISYFISTEKIDDEIMQKVCHDVIGYRVAGEANSWRKSREEDPKVIEEFLTKNERKYTTTDFSTDCFEDGIHDISVDDYWTFLQRASFFERPKFPYTERVLFIKKAGFVMFISVSPSGELCLLHGGHLKKLNNTVQYYYDNLAKYAKTVLSILTPYWVFLEQFGEKIRRIKPNRELLQKEQYKKIGTQMQKKSKEMISFDHFLKKKHDWDYECAMVRFEGRVHGCIIDLDFFNHVYVNPYDGTITPYFAESMQSKHVYSNLASLIADKRPEMLPDYLSRQDRSIAALIEKEGFQKNSLEPVLSEKINTESELVYDTGMYSASRIMRGLQYIYDLNWVCDWYDNILYSNSLPKPENN